MDQWSLLLTYNFLALTPCSCQFLEPRAQVEGCYWFICFGMGINFKKYLNIGISSWYYNTIMARYCPFSMPIFVATRWSWGVLMNFHFWKNIKFQKYLNIKILSWYYTTIMDRYCPLSMPIFVVPRPSRGLLVNLIYF